jgi:hypothetical protein
MELRRWLSSSIAGLPSRLLAIPNRCSSSSIVELDSRSCCDTLLLDEPHPPRFRRLTEGLDRSGVAVDRFGVRGSRERQVSKHSEQEGRPSRSSIGELPMFFVQPSQLKHFLCQYLSAAYTNPPSALRMVTGLKQVGQRPFDPPPTIKHCRHKKRGSSDSGRVGSGYIVASGRKGVAQVAQECVVSDSLGCSTEP